MEIMLGYLIFLGYALFDALGYSMKGVIMHYALSKKLKNEVKKILWVRIYFLRISA